MNPKATIWDLSLISKALQNLHPFNGKRMSFPVYYRCYLDEWLWPLIWIIHHWILVAGYTDAFSMSKCLICSHIINLSFLFTHACEMMAPSWYADLSLLFSRHLCVFVHSLDFFLSCFQRSFPLTEEEYLLRLDDVANTLKCWGAVSHIRNSLEKLKERPRIGKVYLPSTKNNLLL